MTFVIEKFSRYPELSADLEITGRAIASSNGARREELEKRRENILAELERIESEIDGYCPDDPRLLASDARTFLRCRYILGMKLEAIGEFMHVSRDKLFSISRRLTRDVQNGETADDRGAPQKSPMDKAARYMIKCRQR